jgi:hypothetical protein
MNTHHREEMDYQRGEFGDARRCPIHPHVRIGSPNGFFDGLCPECEYANDMVARDELHRLELEALEPADPFGNLWLGMRVYHERSH